MELTKEQIKKINALTPDSEQGVYTEPFGIPDSVKEPVLYMRWESGGYHGGSCWDDRPAYPYDNDRPTFVVPQLVAQELGIVLTPEQLVKIDDMVYSSSDYETEYYGNSTDYETEYIPLSKFLKYLDEL